MPISVGIDLAGGDRRPTGWSCIKNGVVSFETLFQDEDILEGTVRVSPDVVAIDSPLSVPRLGIMRDVDRRMVKQGYRVLPTLFPSMEVLTRRGMALARMLEKRGIEVIEVHPRSSMKALLVNTSNWRGALDEMELSAPVVSPNEHELDAIFAALTGIMYLKNKCESVVGEDGSIVIPRRVS